MINTFGGFNPAGLNFIDPFGGANPGMPETEYRFAYKGTASSNLATVGSPVESVRIN